VGGRGGTSFSESGWRIGFFMQWHSVLKSTFDSPLGSTSAISFCSSSCVGDLPSARSSTPRSRVEIVPAPRPAVGVGTRGGEAARRRGGAMAGGARALTFSWLKVRLGKARERLPARAARRTTQRDGPKTGSRDRADAARAAAG